MDTTKEWLKKFDIINYINLKSTQAILFLNNSNLKQWEVLAEKGVNAKGMKLDINSTYYHEINDQIDLIYEEYIGNMLHGSNFKQKVILFMLDLPLVMIITFRDGTFKSLIWNKT